MQDIERNGFRFDILKRTWGGKREGNPIAGSELVAGLGRFAVYGYSTFSNQFLDICPGQGRQPICLRLLWELCLDKPIKADTVWREFRIRCILPKRGKVENLRL